jgi:hypothetical protein
MRYFIGFMCLLALGVMGCSETEGTGGSGGEGGTGGADPSPYASKDLWLCRPDMESDRCTEADLSMTEVRPDGTLVELDEVAPNPNAEVDCFFVYHTVNHAPEPENTENLSSTDPAAIEPVFKIAAHYRGTCRVFAPLYHQMSLITYTAYWPFWDDTEFFERAYADVVEAFEYYMRVHNEGRDIVLLGHSQGSHMLTKLVQDKFDEDETLREQLVSAVLMGPTAYVQVEEGERAGGSFENIPLCSSASETGCVIAFDANAATGPTVPERSVPVYPPMERACVNPASLEDGAETLAAFMYPRTYEEAIPFPEEVETAWVVYPELYTSACSAERGFAHVLEIAVSSEYQGEVPITPQDLEEALMRVRGFTDSNLHGAEYFLTNANLVPIVEQQIASRRN